MPLEYHWIGSTGNSVDKYDWNNVANWIEQGAPGQFGNDSIYRRPTRTPQAGDTVYIGARFHCYSPLLFGGYTGGLTHNSGFWGISGNSGVVGGTAGVTDGGINLYIYTDKPARSPGTAIGEIISREWSTTNYAALLKHPNMFMGEWAYNNSDYFNFLQEVNPHAELWCYTGGTEPGGGVVVGSVKPIIPSSYDERDSLYPFPYLGGGLTGEILKWAYTQHKNSYNSFAATGNAAYALNNAWVGGGITSFGVDGVTGRASTLGLTIRNKNILIQPGNSEQYNNSRLFDMYTLHDREKLSGIISSKITVNQPSNPNHYYIFRSGTHFQINLNGDAQVEFRGVTAGYLSSSMGNTVRTDEKCVIGGVLVQPGPSTSVRYNLWPLYFAGSITQGAVETCLGAYSQTTPFLPFVNTVSIYPHSKIDTGTTTNTVSGVVSTTNIDTYIGIGKYSGGTAAMTSIPALHVDSHVEGATVPKHSVQFIGSAKIGAVYLSGGSLIPSMLLTQSVENNEIFIGSVNMSNSAYIDFTVNPEFDAIFFGGITGTSVNNYRLIGGINATDESTVVYPSAGVRLVNTKIVNAGDSRGKIGGIFLNAQRFLTVLPDTLPGINIPSPQLQKLD